MLNRLKYNYLFWKNRKAFRQVNQFVLFSGYPRSGHSLVGALMDAHPEMIISHEMDALEMVIQGYKYRQIYAMILENSMAYARKGREWSGYNYTVQGQWQGKFKHLKVIGDKKGGRTCMLLENKFSLIHKMQSIIPVPVRVIHVVRNPFDNIVTRAKRGNDGNVEITNEVVMERIRSHFKQAETNYRVIREGGCRVLTIRHEDVIDDPEAVLKEVCNFLELDAPADWLKACSAIVFKKPHKTRHDFDYPQDMIDEIDKKIAGFPFFAGYTYMD